MNSSYDGSIAKFSSLSSRNPGLCSGVVPGVGRRIATIYGGGLLAEVASEMGGLCTVITQTRWSGSWGIFEAMSTLASSGEVVAGREAIGVDWARPELLDTMEAISGWLLDEEFPNAVRSDRIAGETVRQGVRS